MPPTYTDGRQTVAFAAVSGATVGYIRSVEDIPELRAVTRHNDRDIIGVQNAAPPRLYMFDDTSLAPDNGGTVIKPDDILATDPGRWIEFTSGGSGSGDVTGPASSIQYGIAVYADTTGKIIADSGKRNYGGSATDPVTPAPGDGDLYYNTVLHKWMVYDSTRSKFLSIETQSFGAGRLGITPVGTYYRGFDGKALSAANGLLAPFNGTVVALSYTRSDNDAADFEVTADGATIATVSSAAIEGKDITLNADFAVDQVLAIRNASPGNATTDAQVWITLRWRI